MNTDTYIFDQANTSLGALCDHLGCALDAGMDALIFAIKMDTLPALLELGLDITPLDLPEIDPGTEEPSIACRLKLSAESLTTARNHIAA